MGQKRDQKYIRAFLGHMVRMQEEIGTGGGGFRFMYAAFLHEASVLLSEPMLLEASRKMTGVGDLWWQFALACAKAIRNKTEAPDLEMIATANFCAYEAQQIFGGYGYSKECEVGRLYRDARITTLYEGTSAIQRIVVPRGVPG